MLDRDIFRNLDWHTDMAKALTVLIRYNLNTGRAGKVGKVRKGKKRKRTKRSKWLQMAPNGSRQLQMAPDGSKWLKVT